MKRRGFTLAELLITLCVIGVVAAIMIPSIVKSKPDSSKALYLTTYNELAKTINELANSSNIFPICQGEYCFKASPLFNTSKGVNDKYSAGNGKLCKLLAENLNAQNNSCSDSYEQFDGNFSFTTQKGIQFFVSTDRRIVSDALGEYQTDIYIDVNGPKGPNKLYGEDGCTTPDRFKLLVSAAGEIVIADPMGTAYLKKNKNWLKNDAEIADNFRIKVNLDADMKNVGLEAKHNEGNQDRNNASDEDDYVACGSNYNGKILNCLVLEATPNPGQLQVLATSPVDEDIVVNLYTGGDDMSSSCSYHSHSRSGFHCYYDIIKEMGISTVPLQKYSSSQIVLLHKGEKYNTVEVDTQALTGNITKFENIINLYKYSYWRMYFLRRITNKQYYVFYTPDGYGLDLPFLRHKYYAGIAVWGSSTTSNIVLSDYRNIPGGHHNPQSKYLSESEFSNKYVGWLKEMKYKKSDIDDYINRGLE